MMQSNSSGRSRIEAGATPLEGGRSIHGEDIAASKLLDQYRWFKIASIPCIRVGQPGSWSIKTDRHPEAAFVQGRVREGASPSLIA
jgi:hypothetical protein